MRLCVSLFCLILATPAPAARLAGRVLDSATGRSIPCTVSIRPAGGAAITDHPSYTGGFRSAGTFEKDVPPGRVTITVARGFDYAAQRREIDLRDGERRALTFRLTRRTPLRQMGWVTGDSHVHMVHGERKVQVDFAYVALAARAEGLDYLSLCQHWNVPEETPEELDAACRRVSTPDFRLLWNLEAPKNYWRGDVSHCAGHGWTLGMRGRAPDGRDAIAELLAMSAWDYEREKPPTPNFESHAFIHSLGGIVSYSHPHRWWWGAWGGKAGFPLEEHKRISNMAQELPFNTVAGPTYDSIDIMMQPQERGVNEKAQKLWFMLLNHGYRIAGTASSDTTFDNPGGGVPGKVRVYTDVTGAPSPEAIASAMKAGHNFITSGPLLLLDIGGREPGDTLRLDGPRKILVTLRAWPAAVPGARLTRVELVRNGTVVRSLEAAPAGGESRFRFTIAEDAPAWYIARCFGPTPDEVAITNPVYFETPSYRRPEPAAAHVTAAVRDARTGAPLAGLFEIVQMDGRKPVVISRQAFRDGSFEAVVPATARIRVQAEGYAASMKSVFMDSPPLLDSMLQMTEDQLGDWATFEAIRRHLAHVNLAFDLARP